MAEINYPNVFTRDSFLSFYDNDLQYKFLKYHGLTQRYIISFSMRTIMQKNVLEPGVNVSFLDLGTDYCFLSPA